MYIHTYVHTYVHTLLDALKSSLISIRSIKTSNLVTAFKRPAAACSIPSLFLGASTSEV